MYADVDGWLSGLYYSYRLRACAESTPLCGHWGLWIWSGESL